MTQTTLAEKAGVSRQTLHRAIHEDELSGRVAKRIASVVGVDLLNVDAAAPVVAMEPAARAGGRPAATIPSGAPDDVAEMAGLLTPMGEVLEILRRDDAVSQEAMAARADISVATYRRVITGQTRVKHSWLIAWGEAAELDEPRDMLWLKQFKPGDLFHRAVGRQLHAWRVSAALDLLDVADCVEESVLQLACYEAGDENNFLALEEIAPLYGTTSDVIYRAARLASPDEGDRYRPPVERVLTFEAAQIHAQSQQREREQDRERDEWDFEIASRLWFVRSRAGFDSASAARRLERSEQLLDKWEEGDAEPSHTDFERMAILYRTTPWQLHYGDAWERAIRFPNADESRAVIFGQILPPDLRAWMYQALAEFAKLGMDDLTLTHIRESLLRPDLYNEMLSATSPDDALRFLQAKLHDTATDMWRNITDPDWVERPEEAWKPLPPVFAKPGFDTVAARNLMDELRMQHVHESIDRAHVLLREARGESEEDEDRSSRAAYPGRSDPFSFYHSQPARLRLVAEPATHYAPVPTPTVDAEATRTTQVDAASGIVTPRTAPDAEVRRERLRAMRRPPTHPGEVLREEFLIPMRLSPTALAEQVNVTAAELEAVTARQAVITPALAARLEAGLGMPADFWLNLQSFWDDWHAIHRQ